MQALMWPVILPYADVQGTDRRFTVRRTQMSAFMYIFFHYLLIMFIDLTLDGREIGKSGLLTHQVNVFLQSVVMIGWSFYKIFQLSKYNYYEKVH